MFANPLMSCLTSTELSIQLQFLNPPSNHPLIFPRPLLPPINLRLIIFHPRTYPASAHAYFPWHSVFARPFYTIYSSWSLTAAAFYFRTRLPSVGINRVLQFRCFTALNFVSITVTPHLSVTSLAAAVKKGAKPHADMNLITYT